jgi:S-adenosylmethionine:tRNA ribosyltransferase-isomerase
MNEDLKLESYNFILPKELIAQEPPSKREESRLLVYLRKEDKVLFLKFKDITKFLDDNWCIVLNNTKVEKRRILCKKLTGATLNLIITSYQDNELKGLISPYKKVSLGQKIVFPQNLVLEISGKDFSTGEFLLSGKFTKTDIEKLVSKYGLAPLPPYIKRNTLDRRNKKDLIRYQTVYAKEGSSIAAPTAGFHFSKNILNKLLQKGIKIVYIKLDIGISTFKPVKVDDITKHKMFPEFAKVDNQTAKELTDWHNSGKKILCVGTTTVRTLEYLVNKFNKIVPYEGWVDNFIYPPYEFKIVDGMITNFHLPKSTNFILVSSFVGRKKLLELYNLAIKQKYRFYSYGDAMLII